ncbi:putative membrane protein [Desulfohalotomaculum tongense]|uniref:SdpI family protein n=1 Tax=Desulforadius tongensis TaxID=1216062 RepID=UPI00195B5991|nr:SdpI family protein [Desulforadius tongensis]MBM7854330.1 putative membrane protein [Desulforadius tongensis]
MTGKFNMKFSWLTVLALIIFWGVCASFYPALPDQVPSHWNIRGEVDGYSHKSVVALVMPLLPLVIYVLMTVMPQIDPQKYNYSKFGSSYAKIRTILVLIMMGVTLLPLLSALGYSINIGLLTRIFIPVLFIALGNYMGKIRPNYFIGIRVPWTLASEEVWIKTHRLAGKLMVIGGLIALAGALTPPVAGFIIMMAGILVPLLVTTVYSYFLYVQVSK